MYDKAYPLSLVVVSHGPIDYAQHMTCVQTFGIDYAHTSPYYWLSLPWDEYGYIDGIDRQKGMYWILPTLRRLE